MPKFELEKIDAIVGKQAFYKLLKDGICEFEEFVTQIKAEGSFNKEVTKIYALMQQIAELKTLPQEQFRKLPNPKSEITEYEIKTKHLRVYLFHQAHTGKIIVIGGKKTTQDQDITHFREIKKMYLETLKTK
jgi:putative component of toxin-antitoxin plasmid stabilization module